MKYELSMMSPEKELMKFNCPTLKEAQELAPPHIFPQQIKTPNNDNKRKKNPHRI